MTVLSKTNILNTKMTETMNKIEFLVALECQNVWRIHLVLYARINNITFRFLLITSLFFLNTSQCFITEKTTALCLFSQHFLLVRRLVRDHGHVVDCSIHRLSASSQRRPWGQGLLSYMDSQTHVMYTSQLLQDW